MTMSRVLFTTGPITGHVMPAVPIVRQLVSEGHEVMWYTGRDFQRVATAAGAVFTPVGEKLELGNSALRGIAGRRGMARLNKLVLNVFLKPVPAYVADLAPVFETFRPQVVVSDATFRASLLLGEKLGIARVAFSVGPMHLTSADTAPSGTGLRPSSTPLGKLRNRFLYWVARNFVFRESQRLAERIRADMGLEPLKSFCADWNALIADSYLQLGISEFEYPRHDLLKSVEFIGAMLGDRDDEWMPPPWWPELADAKHSRRPVIFATQGTVATDPARLVLPAISALASTDMLIVATTGGIDPEEVLPTVRRPPNLRIEAYIPFTEILPMADVMITNGGIGGVQSALVHGVPLVVAGTTEDKLEVNARVAWSGAGVSLKTDHPSPARIGAAVRKVLSDPSYRTRAHELRDAFSRYPGAPRAAEVIIMAAEAKSPSASAS
jgi:MGT family glycosyltransferase